MSIYKVFQSAAARKNKSLQASEKLSAALWLKFYVWRLHSPNKENFLSVIKTLFQARKRAYNARKGRKDKTIFKNRLKGFQHAIKRKNGPLQRLSERGKTEKHVAGLL